MSVTDFFDNFVAELENVEGASADVTHKPVSFGSREATTGWRAKTFGSATIKMPVIELGSTFSFYGIDLFAYETALGIISPSVTVNLNDLIQRSDNRYFEVAAREKRYYLNKFAFWIVTLLELPFFEDVPGTLTWSKTRAQDPRRRTKTYIDTRTRVAQITKDNDSTQATWASLFYKPPYSISAEFRAASSPVQGLYAIEMPKSTPVMRGDQIPSHYDEEVPVHIYTIDSTGCTGTALNWKMEEEFRHVLKTYPEGSQRQILNRTSIDEILGGMKLWHTRLVMGYRRNTTD